MSLSKKQFIETVPIFLYKKIIINKIFIEHSLKKEGSGESACYHRFKTHGAAELVYKLQLQG